MPNNSNRFEINPRQRFQRALKQIDDYKSIVGQSLLQDAVQDVLAQMAVRGCSREELNGAIIFADTLLNFAEPEQNIVKLPTRALAATELPTLKP